MGINGYFGFHAAPNQYLVVSLKLMMLQARIGMCTFWTDEGNRGPVLTPIFGDATATVHTFIKFYNTNPFLGTYLQQVLLPNSFIILEN